MISKKEVQHIANLARIGLTEKEVEKMQKELSKILDYIKKIKEVNVSKIIPTTHPFNEMKTWMNNNREDREIAKLKMFPKSSEKLLKLAPETKESFLKVKSILK